MWLRNFFYDKGIFKSVSFPVPVISVGNLSTGGTGKTPHIEYLVRLLKDKYKVATLSRGYGRKTKGFIIVSNPSGTTMVGDEPMQYHSKFPEIIVSVGENRVAAIENLLLINHKPEVIFLDDAFQHRAVKAGLNILLIEYGSVFKRNYILPAGSMREWKAGMKRADIIVVSKSPNILVPIERKRIADRFKLFPKQHLFFSYFKYGDIIRLNGIRKQASGIIGTNYYFENRFSILLATGIADPSGIADYLRRKTDKVETIFFADHHEFVHSDIHRITDAFNNITNKNKIIITTEKDAMRLRNPGIAEEIHSLPVFYLPIEVVFHNDDGKEFDNIVLNYCSKG